MRKITLVALSASLLFIYACSGTGSDQGEETNADTLLTDTSSIDTTEIVPTDTITVDSAGYADEEEALSTQIEKEYGVQWDFCDCVVKNDSVNKAIETAGDEDFDALLIRMDTIDKHCKALLTTPNTTPDEREKHERKVRKCLKNA